MDLSFSLIILFLSCFLHPSFCISFHFFSFTFLLLFTSPSITYPSPLISQPMCYSFLLCSLYSTCFYHNLPLMFFYHFLSKFYFFFLAFYSISYPFPVQLFCSSPAFSFSVLHLLFSDPYISSSPTILLSSPLTYCPHSFPHLSSCPFFMIWRLIC